MTKGTKFYSSVKAVKPAPNSSQLLTHKVYTSGSPGKCLSSFMKAIMVGKKTLIVPRKTAKIIQPHSAGEFAGLEGVKEMMRTSTNKPATALKKGIVVLNSFQTYRRILGSPASAANPLFICLRASAAAFSAALSAGARAVCELEAADTRLRQ